jgi:ribosomal protein S18 acetylase RimI-like enzyme
MNLMPKFDFPPRGTNNVEKYSDAVKNASLHTSYQPEKNFDDFLTNIKDIDYWKTIKDPRFEQYGGAEISNYLDYVGLLSGKRKKDIKEFLMDKGSIYQQGKFLKLLRKKLNEYNFRIDSGKSSIKINKDYGEDVKKEENQNIKQQKIFSDYEIMINDLLNSKKLSYIINKELLKVKEWMNSSDLRKNEEYAMPFKQIGEKNIIIDGTQVYVLEKNKEEIEKLKQEYNNAEHVLKTTDNFILENSDGYFRQFLEILENTKKELKMMVLLGGISLKEYISKIFPNVKESNLEQECFDFLFFISEENYESLKNDFGFNPEELSIEEQLYFLNYIKNKNLVEINKVEDFTKKYKISGFRTFLSIEQGGKEMGDKILLLGEKLPKESCDILFKTYGEMVDATSDVADLLKNNLGEKATLELIESTQESLLFSGKELLERYANKAQTCEGESCKKLGQELKERLSLAKRSVFAFSHACKVLVERGEFSFEDFQKAKLSYDQSPLPEEMQNKIIAMHEENTKQYPEGLRDRWRGTLRDGLANENPDQLVVSASYEDEVVAAMRVIKRKDGSWYGASFNVNPTVQGSRIGTELLKEVLKTLAKDKPFVADCYSKNPMLKTYLEKFGFKITKEIENYEDTGELVFEITIFPEKSK